MFSRASQFLNQFQRRAHPLALKFNSALMLLTLTPKASTMKCALFGAVAITLLAILPETAAAADERTREFPAYKCRYTLPGEDWYWIDFAEAKKPPKSIFTAGTKKKGLALTLTYDRATRAERMDQKFSVGFEKGFYAAGPVTKRGGRFVSFQGLL